jgi:hypothetical protein
MNTFATNMPATAVAAREERAAAAVAVRPEGRPVDTDLS